MTSINTNFSTLLAGAQAKAAQQDAATASTRLASGLRAITAADDAAGLAVYNKMNSQKIGLSAAISNTLDGVSLLQAAMKGLDNGRDIIQRMRELAVQSHNGVYTGSDRQNAQTEITSLLAELDKIATQTRFNNIKLLDGFYESQIRAGNTNPEVVDVSISNMGINENIQTDSYATGSSISILRPIEYATGSSTFGTPDISHGHGVSTPDYLASVNATGTSQVDLPDLTSATGSTTAIFDTTSAAVSRDGSAFSSASVITTTPEFRNGDFSDTTTSVNGDVVSIPGWDIHLERVDLGPTRNAAYTSQIGGYETPDDPTPTPTNSGGDSVSTSGIPTYNYGFGTDGVTLGQNGFSFSPGAGYGVLHGPYIISQGAVSLETNDSVSFDWTATGAGDDYDVFAYLLDENTGNTIVMLDDTRDSGSGTVSTTVTANGSYKFVFISGTYDASGGRFAGAEFSIDNVSVVQANPPPENAVTADISVEAVESDSVTVAASLLSSLQDSVINDPEGTFSLLASSPDASSFSINPSTGDVTSSGPLRFSTQSSYEFDVRYLGPGGLQHIETVTLNLTPHDRANSTLSVQEASTIEILRSNLTSLDDFVSAHGSGGTFSLATNATDPADYLQFSVDANGRITSNSHLDFSSEARFDFNVIYTALSGAQFTNHVSLNLLDTLASTAVLVSEESDQISISAATLSSTADFASRDTGPGGSYHIAATGPDYSMFSVDSSGNVTGTGAFRRSTKTHYEFDLIYRSSAGHEHIEAVSIDMSRFLQAQTILTASEANSVNISLDQFGHLYDFAAGSSMSGSFRLTGADAGLFEVGNTGDVTSRNALEYDTQNQYSFNLIFTSNDGHVFTDAVRLNLTDTYIATTSMTAEESTQIIVPSAQMSSLHAYAAKDSNDGSFSIDNPSGHGGLFAISADGTLTANQEIRMAEYPTLNVDVRYNGISVPNFVETIAIQITPTTYDTTRSIFTSNEATEKVIILQTNPHIKTYAMADNYEGFFSVAQSHLTTSPDHSFFDVDSEGTISSSQGMDYESGQIEFEFKTTYHHSSGTKRFNDYTRLEIVNDPLDDENMALKDIDISTVNGAHDAGLLLEDAMIRMSKSQAQLGAIQNRFTHTLENLNMAALVTERASGRIVDADYAAETARLVKAQLLSNVANTMLVNATAAKNNMLLLINIL